MTNAEKLKKEIELLNPELLNEINDFVAFLVSKQKKESIKEKKTIIESLCGSWADDKSIDVIFREIDLQRHSYKGREVKF
ncbi:MAG: DUF2281 domain-containing protein [Nitrospirae bacterium]|nr:DUF2281 domain-containing protein [Nitrospirota bacterium]